MTEPFENDPLMLTVKEAAIRLSCSVSTVRNLLKLGLIPHLRYGVKNRVIRIQKSDLLYFIDQRRQASVNK